MEYETVVYKGYSVDTEFEYTEGEERTWEYPGSSPEIDLIDVFLEGISIYELIECIPGGIEEIENLIFEKF